MEIKISFPWEDHKADDYRHGAKTNIGFISIECRRSKDAYKDGTYLYRIFLSAPSVDTWKDHPITIGKVRGTLDDAKALAEKMFESVRDSLTAIASCTSEDTSLSDEEDDIPKSYDATEKIVVFRCKYCIEDLKEYNPYVNEKGQGIPLENIICIEVPDEICENTTFELTPILLNKERYSNLPCEEEIILLDRAIKNATDAGYALCVRIWEDQYSRDEGLPYDLSLEECMEDFDNPSEPADELLCGFDGHYNRHGCAEIIARKGEEEYYFYHEECSERHFLPDIFDFITGGQSNEV